MHLQLLQADLAVNYGLWLLNSGNTRQSFPFASALASLQRSERENFL